MNTDDRWSMEVFVAEIDGETNAEVRMTKIDNRNFSGPRQGEAESGRPERVGDRRRDRHRSRPVRPVAQAAPLRRRRRGEHDARNGPPASVTGRELALNQGAHPGPFGLMIS